jgi:hypothetical protein
LSVDHVRQTTCRRHHQRGSYDREPFHGD